MNKLLILLVIVFITNGLTAQIKIEKDQLKTYYAKGHELELCCKQQENVVIAFKRSNKSTRVSMQRNGIALCYLSHVDDLQRKKNKVLGVGTYGSKQFTFLLDEKKHEMIFIYGDEFAYSVNLSWSEQEKLIKYLFKM